MRRSSKPRGTPAGAVLAGGLNRAMFAPEKPLTASRWWALWVFAWAEIGMAVVERSREVA